LRSICRDDHIPHLSNVMEWVVTPEHPFREQYVQAREAAGYAHADKIVEVTRQLEKEELGDRPAKVMLDGLKWAAERMAPKEHSPKQQMEHTGKDGGPIELSDTERATRLASLMSQVEQRNKDEE